MRIKRQSQKSSECDVRRIPPSVKIGKAGFTGIFVPAEVLSMPRLSLVEKLIVCDIGYFSGGYKFSNARMAEKFGVSRRTIINAVSRLKSSKLGLVLDIGPDTYHRVLKLNGAITALFEHSKGVKVALSGAKVAPFNGAKVATKEEHTRITLEEQEREALSTNGFFDFWNSKKNLPEIKIFTKQRKEKLKARLRERQFAENLSLLVDKVACSDFLCGRNERGWRVDVDWLLKNDTNYVKVLEGRYDNNEDGANERKKNGSYKISREFITDSEVGETIHA